MFAGLRLKITFDLSQDILIEIQRDLFLRRVFSAGVESIDVTQVIGMERAFQHGAAHQVTDLSAAYAEFQLINHVLGNHVTLIHINLVDLGQLGASRGQQ